MVSIPCGEKIRKAWPDIDSFASFLLILTSLDQSWGRTALPSPKSPNSPNTTQQKKSKIAAQINFFELRERENSQTTKTKFERFRDSENDVGVKLELIEILFCLVIQILKYQPRSRRCFWQSCSWHAVASALIHTVCFDFWSSFC